MDAFRKTGRSIRNLVLFGSLITWGLCAVFARWLFPELGWGLALLFGSLVIVTGPTVIAPLLHTIHPTKKVADVLRGEAILIDPVGAILAVLTLEFLIAQSAEGSMGELAGHFFGRVGIGIGLGIAGALLLAWLLKQQRLVPPDLQNLTVLVGAIGLYALSEVFMEESGVLTVTLAGFLLAALHPPGIEEVEEFKGHITVLMVSTVFLLLAAKLDLPRLIDLGPAGIVLVLAIIFIARPLTVFLCTRSAELNFRERAFISWIAPRGIVAASVSSLFALLLDARGMPGGSEVMTLTFAVIIGTVLVQGPTAAPVGRWLGVLETARHGAILVGGGRASLELGRAIKRLGPRILILDTNPWRVRQAHEFGLEARRANVMDDIRMEEIDLSGIGSLFSMTPNDQLNRLAARNYQRNYGRDHSRAIRGETSPELDESRHAPYLFGSRLLLEEFQRRLLDGWTIEAVEIDGEVDEEEQNAFLAEVTPLLAYHEKQGLLLLDDDDELPKGTTLLYLQRPQSEDA